MGRLALYMVRFDGKDYVHWLDHPDAYREKLGRKIVAEIPPIQRAIRASWTCNLLETESSWLN